MNVNLWIHILTTKEVSIVFADPRRMTEETKIVISELKKVPQKDLRVSLIVINCDDSGDLRKFLKKNPGTENDIIEFTLGSILQYLNFYFDRGDRLFTLQRRVSRNYIPPSLRLDQGLYGCYKVPLERISLFCSLYVGSIRWKSSSGVV